MLLFFSSHTELLWKEGKTRNRRKIAHLKRKYQVDDRDQNEEIRGVKYRDFELREEASDEGGERSERNEPKVYGGVQMKASGMDILSKSSNFMVLERVDETEMEVEIEKG